MYHLHYVTLKIIKVENDDIYPPFFLMYHLIFQ